MIRGDDTVLGGGSKMSRRTAAGPCYVDRAPPSSLRAAGTAVVDGDAYFAPRTIIRLSQCGIAGQED